MVHPNIFTFLRMWLVACFCFLNAIPLESHAALSTSSIRVLLYVDQQEAYVNGTVVLLDAPATIFAGKTYVPLKFLGDTFGFPVDFDAVTQTVSIKAVQTVASVALSTNLVTIDGQTTALEPNFRVVNNRLMTQLSWLMTQINAKLKYDAALRRIEITYVPVPTVNRVGENSNPVAKFTFAKPTYRIGERIKYIDLSYDADGDGIAFVSWKNNREVFYEAGTYEISLQVTDSKGNVSGIYRRMLTITNEVYMNRLEYAMHEQKPQSIFKFSGSAERMTFVNATKLTVNASARTDRKLLVSDSPERVKEHGILYRDTVNGYGRLYANHLNATLEPLQLAIVATNAGTTPVMIRTTHQGEVLPSIYANLIGHQATVDFLLDDVSKSDLVVEPGETAAYAIMPNFLPGQGVNLIYDIVTNGEITFDFVAMLPGDSLEVVRFYPKLPYDNHVRGSFPVSQVDWEVDATAATGLKAITIGDNIRDKFVMGFDPLRNLEVPNYGNYGVIYNIRILNSGKVAIALLARGGPFKGPFKINGEMVLAPASGTITPFDGTFILMRTVGNEPFIDLIFSPPAGSAFPIDLVLYPLR
jgi:hypothetical protein